MNQRAPHLARLTPLQRATTAMQELRARLDAASRMHAEPVAIVGMGCRFPGGADTPERFWQLLVSGRDVITEVPPSRWEADAWFDPDPEAGTKMYTRRGGFLSEPVDTFAASFFGISPREAAGMDPQQRLLLEVSWEALEHAGIAADQLVGSQTGVYVGTITSDYGMIHPFSQVEPADLPYIGLGNASSFPPDVCRTPSACRDQAWSSPRPARRRWWQLTWRCRRCGLANVRSRWRAEST